jgi:hypothetical protein
VPVAEWKTVVHSVPDLKYVLPSTFEKVGILLNAKGLNLQPPPPDEPQYIGKSS